MAPCVMHCLCSYMWSRAKLLSNSFGTTYMHLSLPFTDVGTSVVSHTRSHSNSHRHRHRHSHSHTRTRTRTHTHTRTYKPQSQSHTRAAERPSSPTAELLRPYNGLF
eukprot:1067437-Pyramimonas_sp.AAC.1